MNSGKLAALYQEYLKRGLYVEPFDCIALCIHRLVQYANNVLLVEADLVTPDEVLIIYTIHEEAKRCLYWTDEMALEFVNKASFIEFSTKSFSALYETHFRGNKIFEEIDTKDIVTVYSLSSPAYDDWYGEFFIITQTKKFVLMWDYCD